MSRAARLFIGLGLMACNGRFDFDVPPPEGGRGGSGGDGGASATGAGGANPGGSGGAVGCGTRRECPDVLHCSQGKCVECGIDADCSSAEAPRCDSSRRRCVACLLDTDCKVGFTCDDLANRCLRVCGEKMACPPTAHGCDEGRGVCYECDADHECSASPLGPRCAADGSGCVQCRVDGDCTGQFCDPLTGRCVGCRDGGDCATGLCDPGAHVCLR